ncbi:hypothetical protein ABID65_006667 [Bradyrhizobium sp. S3.9.2]|uniref:hypothetical protein n=1 Tax=Bradyrhizobium sp. S3.9.2 TaxID=3156432 RepID=UPI0033951C73
MKLDRMLYLVISDHCGHHHRGPIIYEIEPDNMDRSSVAEDISHGQYGRVLHVIELNPAEGICREVTNDFQKEEA